MKELLTHSRQDSFKTCRRKHWYSYELGLRPIDDAKALRMGSAFHAGLQQLGNGIDLATTCDIVREAYAERPEAFDERDWDLECETVLRLVCAYDWRWQTMSLDYVAVELPFEIPLINPKTGRKSPLFNVAGKIDAIVRMEDGRLAVKESKLIGEDISQDSTLWRRMRIDHQVTLYMLAARSMGYDIQAVLYDVGRKPTISPTDVPILDELGAKIVLDGYGIRVRTEAGKYRQTGDKEKGYVLQTRPMTVEEWGEKLSADIGDRPDYYFARHEIPRLADDLAEYESELWDIAQQIRDAQKNKRWYRTVNKNTCQYCPYFEPCSQRVDVSGQLPVGFEFVYDRHPELERTNGNSTFATETSPAETGSVAIEVGNAS